MEGFRADLPGTWTPPHPLPAAPQPTAVGNLLAMSPASRQTVEASSHHAPPAATATVLRPWAGRARVRYFGQIYAQQIFRMEDVMATVRSQIRAEEKMNRRTGLARLVADRKRALAQVQERGADAPHGVAAQPAAEHIRRETDRVRRAFDARHRELTAQHARARRDMAQNLMHYRLASEQALRAFIRVHDALYRAFRRDEKALPADCPPQTRAALTADYLAQCAANARLSMQALHLLKPSPNYHALLACPPPEYGEARPGQGSLPRQTP